MTDKSLRELADRVEMLEGPVREIDVVIFKIVNPARCAKILRDRNRLSGRTELQGELYT